MIFGVDRLKKIKDRLATFLDFFNLLNLLNNLTDFSLFRYVLCRDLVCAMPWFGMCYAVSVCAMPCFPVCAMP